MTALNGADKEMEEKEGEEGEEKRMKLMLLEVIDIFSRRESITISVNISVTTSKIIFNSWHNSKTHLNNEQ